MNDTNLTEAEPVETDAATPPIEHATEAEPQAEGSARLDIETALPESMRQSRAQAVRHEHPAGEAFFRGQAEQITDAEAEEVARQQLERSGLLRGQRVRVAD